MLITREDPNVWTSTQLDHYKADELLTLNDIGFKLAFGMYESKSGVNLCDPDLFEWQVFLSTYKDNSWQGGYRQRTHICTHEDISTFYEARREDKALVEKLIERGTLLCIDEDQVMEIRGESDFDSVELSIALIGCDSSKDNHTCKYQHVD